MATDCHCNHNSGGCSWIRASGISGIAKYGPRRANHAQNRALDFKLPTFQLSSSPFASEKQGSPAPASLRKHFCRESLLHRFGASILAYASAIQASGSEVGGQGTMVRHLAIGLRIWRGDVNFRRSMSRFAPSPCLLRTRRPVVPPTPLALPWPLTSEPFFLPPSLRIVLHKWLHRFSVGGRLRRPHRNLFPLKYLRSLRRAKSF